MTANSDHQRNLSSALSTIADALGDAGHAAASIQLNTFSMNRRFQAELARLHSIIADLTEENQRLRQENAILDAAQKPERDYMKEWKNDHGTGET